MTLTPEEKVAGRAFREAMQNELLAYMEADPPTYTVPNFIANYRHLCDARSKRSAALVLRELCVLSPALGSVPEGLFAFLWREGRCADCGHTARSRAGRLVLTRDRPPLSERQRVTRRVHADSPAQIGPTKAVVEGAPE